MTTRQYDAGSVRPFIILSGQRSGSTFVRIWLNQHSKIHSYGEVFLGHYESMDGFRAYCYRNTVSKWLFKIGRSRLATAMRLGVMPRRFVENYLDVLFHDAGHPAPWTDISDRVNVCSPREGKPLIGFKVMYNTIAQYPSLDDWLDKRRPMVIHLTRNNLLRKYASMVRMDVTRIAHSKDALQAKMKVTIDVDKFIEFANKQTSIVKEYRDRLAGKVPYMELSYEEYFADMEASKNAILSFLGVDNEDMPFHEMRKLGSTNLGDDIENWNEVLMRLHGTEYADYLEAPECSGVVGGI